FRPSINYLGRSQFAADPYFSGAIDELHIFHRELDVSEIDALRLGTAPVISANPLVLTAANPGAPYASSVAGNASASGGVLYEKVGGPTWLTVDPDGRVSGVPGDGDSGSVPFRVRAVSATAPVLAADFELRVPVGAPADLRAHYELDVGVADSAHAFHATAHG